MMQRVGEQIRGTGAWLRRQGRENPLGSGLVTIGLVILLVVVVETVRLRNTGFEDKSLWDWLGLLLVPLALGLGGSVFAFRLTRSVEARQERNTLTVEIYNQYMARFRGTGRLRAMLETGQESELSPGDRNDLRDFGNWLDLVATLANQGLLNDQLLAEWQIDRAVCNFYRQSQRFAFLAQAYDASWRNMRRYCEGGEQDGSGV